ncbi:MAG: branched-chain amino acid ABC transporter permease, partial [Oscillospiraceae bacterium]|nr:branched-chain amino acid ABC transporter permease [Oscillospiraceae bacterium]
GYLNFSHSNTITLGALLIYTVINTANIPYALAFFIVLAVMMLYGLVIEKILFRHFANTTPLVFMLVSISLSIVISNLCLLIFGPQPRALTNVFPNIRLHVAGVGIPFNNLCIFSIAVIALIALQLFFTKTKFGLAMRLASEDPRTAGLMGIRVTKTRMATFAISATLGAIAGMLFSPLYSVTIELGAFIAMKTFVSAVVGGLGNFVGAIAGGILVGFIETFSSVYISSAYKDLFVYVAGIIVLVFFPRGLFRRDKNKF